MKKKKLNKVAQAWVKALRSGKYRKGTGQLKTDKGRYCCLGVLCELAVKAGVVESFRPDDGNLYSYRKITKWSGLSTSNGDIDDGKGLDLTDYNDGSGTRPKSFAKIADLIESQPEGLFR